jgi:hypothetical protein
MPLSNRINGICHLFETIATIFSISFIVVIILCRSASHRLSSTVIS